MKLNSLFYTSTAVDFKLEIAPILCGAFYMTGLNGTATSRRIQPYIALIERLQIEEALKSSSSPVSCSLRALNEEKSF